MPLISPPTNYISLFITTYVACYTVSLNTVTDLLEYLDLIALLEYLKLLMPGWPGFWLRLCLANKVLCDIYNSIFYINIVLTLY